MSVDLSALDLGGDFASLMAGDVSAAATGEPMMLLLELIEEDPNQPRTEFDITDLRASIRANLAHGKKPIKNPVSVKKHPTKPGHWLLNDGARRYRSALAEGLQEIPAFIDQEHDKVDQLVVNIHAAGNSPLEVASVIGEMLAGGISQKKVAELIGKNATYVNKHAALINLPATIKAAYDAGHCRALDVLYLLASAYKEQAERVDEYCTSPESSFTRVEVLAFLKGAKVMGPDAAVAAVAAQQAPAEAGQQPAAVTAQQTPAEAGQQPAAVTAQQTPAEAGQQPAAVTAQQAPAEAGQQSAESAAQQEQQAAGSVATSTNKPVVGAGKAAPDENRIKKPVVTVEYEGRAAKLLLDRRSGEPGSVWVYFYDEGADELISLSALKLTGLLEEA